MTREYLQSQLELWRRWLLVSAGAAATLLATALADAPNPVPRPFFPGWYALWLILEIGLVTPGISMLLARGWRMLPLDERRDTAFGYLLAAWVVFVALYIQAERTSSGMLGFLVLAGGLTLAVAYWRARRWPARVSEELFP